MNKHRSNLLAVALTLTTATFFPLHAGLANAAESESSAAELERARADLRAAREELAKAAARLGELSIDHKQLEQLGDKLIDIQTIQISGSDEHARIGVVLSGSKNGPVVSAVSPGSPAEKSGIRNGDVLASINGQALPTSPLKQLLSNDIEWVDGSDPGVAKARELLSKLKDGEAVRLGLQRDGKAMQLSVKAEKRDSWRWPELANLSNLDRIREIEKNITIIGGESEGNSHVVVKHFAPTISMRKGGELSAPMQELMKNARAKILMINDDDWRHLQLSSLNPELGRYFGTTRGVLVLERGGKSFGELQPGDVLLSVDGQPVNAVSEAVRRLSEKPSGTPVMVQLMRDKKVQNVRVIAPEHGALFAPPPPPPPPPPALPALPALPKPPRAEAFVPSAPLPPMPPAAPLPPRPAPLALNQRLSELL